MSLKKEIERLTPEDGISFLELLAHNLTIAVRIVSSRREPYGELTEEQVRNSMYWINEALHNVVQLTRDLRIGRQNWEANDIHRWLELWLGYKHAGQDIDTAIKRTLNELSRNGI